MNKLRTIVWNRRISTVKTRTVQLCSYLCAGDIINLVSKEYFLQNRSVHVPIDDQCVARTLYKQCTIVWTIHREEPNNHSGGARRANMQHSATRYKRGIAVFCTENPDANNLAAYDDENARLPGRPTAPVVSARQHRPTAVSGCTRRSNERNCVG